MLTGEAEIIIDAGTAGESEAEEIMRNLRLLYGTQAGELGLDRDFGIDMTGPETGALDMPMEMAKARLTAEYVRKTQQYEPRVRVKQVDYSAGDATGGQIKPKVVIEFV